MDRETVPRLLKHLHDVELGDPLFDPPRQKLGSHFGPAAGVGGELKRLVRGEQTHPSTFETMLDPGTGIGTPRDPVDRFADHVIEPAAGGFGFGEQILDATVARDGNLELLVRAAAPANGQIHSPGLDIVEMRDDQRILGQRDLRGPQLARQRQGRILLIIGRGPAHPSDPEKRRNLLRHTAIGTGTLTPVRATDTTTGARVRVHPR
ncbi:hypothetical protein ACFYXQ_03525 [Nocardia jiangxiensis]|uniref:Uncharacterized protein n=1 Tax=Nocardia jiangxiensis TaxID=282685 RepID=A0ABW6RS35_9NOCA